MLFEILAELVARGNNLASGLGNRGTWRNRNRGFCSSGVYRITTVRFTGSSPSYGPSRRRQDGFVGRAVQEPFHIVLLGRYRLCPNLLAPDPERESDRPDPE